MPHELVLRDYHPKRILTPGQIKIYHPGYDDELGLLVTFPGYDSSEGDLWHDFAHTACAIVSNNRFDGWLSTSRDPEAPRFLGQLLASGDYWWHLPGDNTQPYAIIPDFRSWQFPRSVPEAWTSQTLGKEQAETTCQVFREGHASDGAHIIPSSETEWYNKSGLGLSYGSDAVEGTALDAGIDNNDNLVQLRSDLHHAWDRKKFTFVPKQTEKDGSKVVLHCWDEEMATGYHNIPLQGFVRREFLLARFAWTLLPRALSKFLLATKESLMLWIRDDHGKLVPQKRTAEQCSAIAYAPVPRSTSPKERKQNDGGQQVVTTGRNYTGRSYRSFDSGLELEEEDDDDDQESDDDSQSILDPEELTRGRKRLRAGDDWYAWPEHI